LGKNLSQQIKSEVDEIANRLQTPFFLVVVGDFKRGKSTLINALLKQEVVTTDITPETVTLNQIQSGPELKIEACLTDGGRIGLDAAELKAEQLTALLGELSQKVSHLNIEVPNEWLEGLCLVDTPGTGDIFQRFDPQVHDYLEKADAVIFVISALSPLSASEQAFLQLSVLPQDFSKVFLVVNQGCR
jgi:predicted GTPase